MRKLLLLALLIAGWVNVAIAEKISSYRVDITVEQSGELRIVEFIDYDFENAPNRHGIYRDIPHQIKNRFSKKDIGLYDFYIEMDSAPVHWEKSIQNSVNAGSVQRLKIGSADKLVSGKHTYTISYRVKLGVLPAAQNKQKTP